MSAKIGRTLSDMEKGAEIISNEIPSIYPTGSLYTIKKRGKSGTRKVSHNEAALKIVEEVKIKAAIHKLKKVLAANTIAKALKKNTQKHKSPSHKESIYTSSRRAFGNVKRSIRNTLSNSLSLLRKGGKRTRKQKRK